jgi:hypothetical protein
MKSERDSLVPRIWPIDRCMNWNTLNLAAVGRTPVRRLDIGSAVERACASE